MMFLFAFLVLPGMPAGRLVAVGMALELLHGCGTSCRTRVTPVSLFFSF